MARSRSELRALGVPDEVIARLRRRNFTEDHRYESTLSSVAVDERAPDRTDDLREFLRRRVRDARARHGLN